MSTISISLSFCQKVCVSIPTSTCGFLPLTWTISGPSIVTIFSSGNNAIIKPIYGSVGNTMIAVSDVSGTMISISVNVTSPFGLSVVNPKYQYVYSASVLGLTLLLQSTASILGNFNSLIVPFQPNICCLCCPQITALLAPVFSCAFVPGSTSFLKLGGNFVIGTLTMGFSLFKQTLNTNIDPLLPLACQFSNPIFISSNIGLFTYQFFPPLLPVCDISNYMCIVQSNTLNVFVSASLLDVNNVVNLQTNVALTGTEVFSLIVVPKNFFDITSSTLICSQITTVTVTTAVSIITITVPSIPILTGVVWYCTLASIGNHGFFINGVIQVLPTSLTIALSSIGGVFPASLDFAVFCFKTQTILPLTLTFP